MNADATLVDAKTGAVILRHPNLTTSVAAVGGVIPTLVVSAMEAGTDTTDTLANNWGATYRDWLLRRA
jgi:hypothetical protein